MRSTVMRNNSAANTGGALSVSLATHMLASDCLFEGNKVVDPVSKDPGSGGALFVDGTASVSLSNSTLTKNYARYGGAVYACVSGNVNLNVAVQVSDNKAVTSGGADYLADSSTVSLSHGIFIKGNSAGQDGGGIAAVYNSTLELGSDVQVTNNTAKHNGGGISSTENSSVTILSEPGPTNGLIVTGNVASSLGGGFCLLSKRFSWQAVKAAASFNTAPYGADWYVLPERLQLVNGISHLNITSRLDGSGVHFTVNATGFAGIPSPLDVQALLQGGVFASLKTDAITGLAIFQVPVRRPPGRYPVTFKSALVDDNTPIEEVTVVLNVLGCSKGDVVASTGDACITCVAGSYSLEPHNTTCDKCPDNAVCPGAWAVLPMEGYWSSSPDSAQIHR
jgi:predicted outer membrane repeat protein